MKNEPYMIYSVSARDTTPPEHKVKDRHGFWSIKQSVVAFPGYCIVEQERDEFWGGEVSKTYTSELLHNPTWGDLFKCSQRAMVKTRDFHHQFFEGFYVRGQREVHIKGNEHVQAVVLRLSLGS